ncbi:hypothetical protein rsdtw13_27930 [Clostridium sp. TW13]|uniref:Uncharacterized protein n=1 Tax=Inconstantimicrobium mannanitabidum TaxID=1604901 RepID=A0ACB5REN2_9CLOT|nr:hypothetical protein rsdtw13_27930 [Clostridium sp. TW13]
MNLNNYFSLILLISTLVLMYIGYFAWKKGKGYVCISLIPVLIYTFGYAFEILSGNIEWVKFWIKVEYLGIAFLPIMWLIFVLKFSSFEENLKKRCLVLLYIIPIITVVLNYTNDFHHLFYKNLYINNHGIFSIVEIVKGPWYWVNIAYAYVVMLSGLLILVLSCVNSISIIRKQIIFLIIAWIIPWTSNIIYMAKLLPFNIDLCPLTFSISEIIFCYAVLRFKLLKITPIALEKVFWNMQDGVIILDPENNIVNFNDASKNIISELKYIDAGDKKIDDVLKKHKDIITVINDDSYNDSLISIKNKEQTKYYKINNSKIYENDNEVIGKIIILNDVTEIELQRKRLSDNLNFLQTLIDAIPNPIYSKDEYGVYNMCNSAFTEYLGIKKEELIGNPNYKIFEKGLVEVYDETSRDLINEQKNKVYESKLMHKDGTSHDVLISKSVISDGNDDKGLVGVIIDITESKKNEANVKKLSKFKEAMLKIGYSFNENSNINDLLQVILEEVINCVDRKSSGSVLLLDEDKNLKIIATKGYDLEEAKSFVIKLEEHFSWFNNGENIDKTVIFNDIDKMNGILMLDTETGEKIKSSASSPIIIDDKLYGFLNIDSIYNNFFGEDDLELLEYMRNQVSIAITKHKLYEKTIYLSRYDRLTSVYNRSYFEELLNNIIYDDAKDKKDFLVVVFDLNELKFVNDNYGHLAGDGLIKVFSRGLVDLCEPCDFVGRFGGDEFVGVFFNVDEQSLVSRFEELLESFKVNPVCLDKNDVICSYSYGIANYPQDGIEFDQLIKVADKHMYEYKNIAKAVWM